MSLSFKALTRACGMPLRRGVDRRRRQNRTALKRAQAGRLTLAREERQFKLWFTPVARQSHSVVVARQ